MSLSSPSGVRDAVTRDLSELRETQNLVKLIRSGDVPAFGELYQRFWNPLYNFAFRYVQSAEEAEDVVQELFFRIWRNRAQWQVGTSLQNYLYAAARNGALARLRRHASARRWREKRIGEEPEESSVSADELLYAAETSAEIERALSEMPPKRRAVCALRWIDGLMYAEIAERLGITEKTVENHLGTGLKFMRERISRG